MKILYLICARGGSKGVIRKNLQSVGPWTLVEWSIHYALLVADPSDIYVSSDDPEIISVAQTYNVNAVLRPAELSTDTSPEDDTWKYMIDIMSSTSRPDVIVIIPPTSPLRSIKYIPNVISQLESGVDLVASARESIRNPWFNMVSRKEALSNEFRIVNSSESTGLTRRQDAPNVYDLTTAFFAFKAEAFSQVAWRYALPFSIAVVDELYSLDIDTPYDLFVARSLFNSLFANDDEPYPGTCPSDELRGLLIDISNSKHLQLAFRSCKDTLEASIKGFLCGYRISRLLYRPSSYFLDCSMSQLSDEQSEYICRCFFAGYYNETLRPIS
jgi:CMP-N-acetylneuraminic acid synthetase